MSVTRRGFLAGSTAAVAGSTMLSKLLAAKAGGAGIHVGVCDWSIGGRGKVEALDTAKKIVLDGVQISPLKPEDVLSYARPETIKAYKEKMKATGLVVSGLGITVGNQCPLATDGRAVKWMEQTIDATAELGASAILMAFFGKGDMRAKSGGGGDKKSKKGKKGKKPDAPAKPVAATASGLKQKEFDGIVANLKQVASRAADKGVTLGLENTLSAKQNIEIMDAVGAPVVQVYYDIANSTRGGYDVPAEIRLLKGRINEFHFKENKGGFPDGSLKMDPIVAAIKETSYQGWLTLERSFGEPVAYFSKNAKWIRKAFGLKTPTY
jgi:L-ribulose-5-phosphate 3-epimerase